MRDPVALPITEITHVGDARRTVTALAGRLNFTESARSNVGIVVTELATNLVRHAKSGQLVVRSITAGESHGIELLALDRGPGIHSIGDAMRDGFSSGSTPGNGLGAVRRLSHTFEIFSAPAAGTAILCRFWDVPPATSNSMRFGVVCLPTSGEEACGDAWHFVEDGAGRTIILVSDGLGHGMQAAEASRLAVQLFTQNARLTSRQVVELLHAGMRSTRGAAIAVADIRRNENEVRFTGIGNISASIVKSQTSKSMVSHNGTAGVEARRIQEFIYPWSADSLLIMHSDGLATQWQLKNYNALQLKDPSLIAGVLFRDFRRERDDVTVLAIAETRSI